MDKCIQFNSLTPEDRVKALVMAARTAAFQALLESCADDCECCLRSVLELTAEHLNHMNTISGGKYGSTIMDFRSG